LPQPLVIPDMMILATLADVRDAALNPSRGAKSPLMS
jgi:hypothetical protein